MKFKFRVFLLTALMLSSSFIPSKSWGDEYVYFSHWSEALGVVQASVKEGDVFRFKPIIPREYRKAWIGYFTGLLDAKYSLEDIKADYYFDYVVENGHKCNVAEGHRAMPNVDYVPNSGGVRFSWYDKNEPWGRPFIQITDSYDRINIQTLKNKDSNENMYMCVLLYYPRVHVRFKRGSKYGWVEYVLNKSGAITGRGLDTEGRRADNFVKFHLEERFPKIRISAVIINKD